LGDKSSLPFGTTRINVLRKESTLSDSIILEDNKFKESTTQCEKNCFCISLLADGLNILSLWPRNFGWSEHVCYYWFWYFVFCDIDEPAW